jgi:hypothetical protein
MLVRYRFLLAVVVCGLLATAVALFSIFPSAEARPYARTACPAGHKHC